MKFLKSAAISVVACALPLSTFGQSPEILGHEQAFGVSSSKDGLAISGDIAVMTRDTTNAFAFPFKRVDGSWVFETVPGTSDTDFIVGSEVVAAEFLSSGEAAREAFLDPNSRKTLAGNVFAELVGDGFGASVAMQGDTLVISDPGDDVKGVNAGAVYVFNRVGGRWEETAILRPENSNSRTLEFGGFGLSVDIDGDTIVVGAPERGVDFMSVYNSNGDFITGTANPDNGEGNVYVFERAANGQWSQTDFLPGPGTFSNFGINVSVSGDSILVGAPLRDTAYYYHRGSDNTWGIRRSLPGSGLYNNFGDTVEVVGDIAVVSSPSSNSSGNEVFVYQWDASAWTLTETIRSERSGSSFGFELSFDGSTIAAAAPNLPALDNFVRGGALLYTFQNGAWTESFELRTTIRSGFGQPSHGQDVVVDGDNVFVMDGVRFAVMTYDIGAAEEEVVPVIDGVEATVYVNSMGIIVGCDLDGQVYSGVLIGTEGADVIVGTNDDDEISSGAGNDTISGGAGDDTIDGGDGADTLLGDAGNDTLNGDGGNDTLRGGDGNDQLSGGAARDTLFGDAGEDFLSGGGGVDALYGGADNDTLNGDQQGDKLFGGDGDDALNGGQGMDQLFGEAGADNLNGGNGRDTLRGGLGDDTLNGARNPDRLFGDDGNDTLIGGGGRDLLNGGNGVDTANGGPQRDSCVDVENRSSC